MPVFLFFASISTLCPKPSDISCSIFKRSLDLVLVEFLVVFLEVRFCASLTVNFELTICFARFKALLGSRETRSLACHFSKLPCDNSSRTGVGSAKSRNEFAIVLLALPVAPATSSWVSPNSLLSLS